MGCCIYDYRHLISILFLLANESDNTCNSVIISTYSSFPSRSAQCIASCPQTRHLTGSSGVDSHPRRSTGARRTCALRHMSRTCAGSEDRARAVANTCRRERPLVAELVITILCERPTTKLQLATSQVGGEGEGDGGNTQRQGHLSCSLCVMREAKIVL